MSLSQVAAEIEQKIKEFTPEQRADFDANFNSLVVMVQKYPATALLAIALYGALISE